MRDVSLVPLRVPKPRRPRQDRIGNTREPRHRVEPVQQDRSCQQTPALRLELAKRIGTCAPRNAISRLQVGRPDEFRDRDE